MLQPLSDEFTLVQISDATTWATIARRLDVTSSEVVDFDKGCVVGVLANVGEAAGEAWPVQISQMRLRNGEGFLEAEFTPGIYYPLQTAGYLDLVFVPGLKSVRLIRVGHHTFRILTRSEMH